MHARWSANHRGRVNSTIDRCPLVLDAWVVWAGDDPAVQALWAYRLTQPTRFPISNQSPICFKPRDSSIGYLCQSRLTALWQDCVQEPSIDGHLDSLLNTLRATNSSERKRRRKKLKWRTHPTQTVICHRMIRFGFTHIQPAGVRWSIHPPPLLTTTSRLYAHFETRKHRYCSSCMRWYICVCISLSLVLWALLVSRMSRVAVMSCYKKRLVSRVCLSDLLCACLVCECLLCWSLWWDDQTECHCLTWKIQSVWAHGRQLTSPLLHEDQYI